MIWLKSSNKMISLAIYHHLVQISSGTISLKLSAKVIRNPHFKYENRKILLEVLPEVQQENLEIQHEKMGNQHLV